LDTKIRLVKLKTLHPELICSAGINTPYPVTHPIGGNYTGNRLVYEEATTTCLLFCHQENSLNNNMQNCELLYCPVEK